MKNKTRKQNFISLFLLLGLAAAIPIYSVPYQQVQTPRDKKNIDIGWKFNKGDAAGAEAAAFGDNSWTPVSLPHTFEYTNLNATAYYRGIGWYRKHQTFSQADSGKRFTLYFEGAMTVAEVWINGTKLATHYGGFNPFCHDITQYVKFGTADNVIAVRVNNAYQNQVPPEKPDGSDIDFILPGGIYRDVYLITTNKDLFVPEPIHGWNSNWTDQGGHFITFQAVTTASATVKVQTWVKNASAAAKSCRMVSVLVDSANQIVQTVETTQSVAANSVSGFSQNIAAGSPHLWYPWDPYRHNVYTTIYDGTNAVDYYKTTVGIRSITFTKDGGAFANGQNFKILGTNRHQHWPFVGGAVPNIQQVRDAEILKDMGCNFLRLSHYLQDDAFLDACDRLGMLTWIEIPGWHCCDGAPSEADVEWINRHYEAISSNVRTARNHPCVAIWGVGINEAPQVTSIETKLNDRCHAEDNTRPTSMGRNYETANGIFDFYGHNSFTYIPAANPSSAATGYMVTEHTGHTFPTPRTNAESSQLQLSAIHEMMTAFSRQKAWVAGVLGWCGFDYNTACCQGPIAPHGAIDIMRIPKFVYYFYKSQSAADNYDGSKHPMVFIANFYMASSPLDRKVYSNCQQVRLYKNNVLVATQSPDASQLDVSGFSNSVTPKTSPNNLAHPPFTFKNVTFTAGELRAEGLIGGQVVATHTVKTPGAPAAIVLKADPPQIEANGGDFSRIIASVVDANGTVVPTATNSISFAISGGGATLIGENPMAAQAGMNIILAKSSLTLGEITVTAASGGLTSGSTKVNAASSIRTAAEKSLQGREARDVALKITGGRFSIPAECMGRTAALAIYDLTGKLICRTIVMRKSIDLEKELKITKGVYIAKLRSIR
jgi:hypothetical protein